VNYALRKNFNIFTADIEEFFQVEAFSGYIKKDDWDKYPGRVEKNTERLLEIMDHYHVKGTFFIVGWVAERNPALVKMIFREGHEISSHGYSHTMVTKMTQHEFREDIRRAKKILEDITGGGIIGYRAPTFSIVKDTTWAYEILLEEGYRYSSSVFPIKHDRYGWIDFGLRAKVVAASEESELWEFPMSVWDLGSIKIPLGGGGYLRTYPFGVTRYLARSIIRKGRPLILYVHPWELDENHPSVNVPLLTRVRHFIGITGLDGKLKGVLNSFSFCPFKDIFESYGNNSLNGSVGGGG
jgi:polysaccharide deacetylase family protein (PEP-CTERM system associated)